MGHLQRIFGGHRFRARRLRVEERRPRAGGFVLRVGSEPAGLFHAQCRGVSLPLSLWGEGRGEDRRTNPHPIGFAEQLLPRGGGALPPRSVMVGPDRWPSHNCEPRYWVNARAAGEGALPTG